MQENQCNQCGRIMQKIGRHWYCKVCDEKILYPLFVGQKAIADLKEKETVAAEKFQIENDVIIKYIGEEREVVVPDGIVAIGNNAFAECENLRSISIPEGVLSIGDSAFYDCERLKKVYLPNGLQTIGKWSFFNCCKLEEIVLPPNVTSIGIGAFSECTELKSINIPQGIKEIGDSVFSECISLKTLTLPEGVTEIGENAFCGCSSLIEFTIPDSVKIIKDHAFFDMDIEKIFIPESVSYMGYEVFKNFFYSIKIYVQAEKKPKNWDEDWCVEADVIWGYKN